MNKFIFFLLRIQSANIFHHFRIYIYINPKIMKNNISSNKFSENKNKLKINYKIKIIYKIYKIK